MPGVNEILCQIESGDPSAAEKLLPLVYDELRKLDPDDGVHLQNRSSPQPVQEAAAECAGNAVYQ